MPVNLKEPHPSETNTFHLTTIGHEKGTVVADNLGAVDLDAIQPHLSHPSSFDVAPISA